MRVVCLWLGGAELSEARRRQLDRLRSAAGVPVELVTEANLDDWIVPEAPLHPAWDGLTAMHQADYLRAYVAAHHGGGYADIKAPSGDWTSSFELVASGAVDCVGYPVPGPSNAARFGLSTDGKTMSLLRPALFRHVAYRLRHRKLIGAGAFIFRRRSPIAFEYLRNVERVLSRVQNRLDPECVRRSDGTRLPGFEVYRGDLVGYPLTWGSLAMDVIQPLGLKYRKRISLTLPEPVWQDQVDYR